MTQDSSLASCRLISDRFAIRAAVTTIRNAFTRSRDRNPLQPSQDERRTAARIIVQVPVTVTPAIVDGHGVRIPKGNCALNAARSRDISLGGVGFAHELPLASGHAVIQFNLAAAEPIYLVLEVAWSHRQPDGSYVSGSKIMGVLDPTKSDSAGPEHREAVRLNRSFPQRKRS